VVGDGRRITIVDVLKEFAGKEATSLAVVML
jgi:hypothetical protein